MATQNKVITPDTKLTALALFTVAAQHYAKMREMEAALSELLGYGEDGIYCGCLSDELYRDGGGNFEEGMKREGFTVQNPTVKKPKARR